MSADDFDYDDEDFEGVEPEMMAEAFDGGEAEENGGDDNALGLSWAHVRQWFTARRGWILIIGLSIAQAAFATIMIYLRSEAKGTNETVQVNIRELAVDMLGHEVRIDQMFQLVPMRGGKFMTVGLDMVLLLGQLPEEQIEDAPRPTPEEMQQFIAAVEAMEPTIRSRVNQLLQQMPAEDLGTVEALETIKNDVRLQVNDTMERLDFGRRVRGEIGRRRVTEVLLPMFVLQNM